MRPDASGARTIVTPIVPVLVGDDWKAALLWRALYDAGVFVNTALHPAVPPGGALLRTSVMATHDAATLDRALEMFAAGQARVRGRARPAAGPRRAEPRRTRFSSCPNLHKSSRQRKSPLLAHEPHGVVLTAARVSA